MEGLDWDHLVNFGVQSLVVGGQTFRSTRTLPEIRPHVFEVWKQQDPRGVDNLVELSQWRRRSEREPAGHSGWGPKRTTVEASGRTGVAAPLCHLDLVADWPRWERPPRRRREHRVCQWQLKLLQNQEVHLVSVPTFWKKPSASLVLTIEVLCQYSWLKNTLL